jgi:hypothetical protein
LFTPTSEFAAGYLRKLNPSRPQFQAFPSIVNDARTKSKLRQREHRPSNPRRRRDNAQSR